MLPVFRLRAPKCQGLLRGYYPPMTRAAYHARLRRLGTAGIFPFRESGLFPVRTKSYYTKPGEKCKSSIVPGGKMYVQLSGITKETDKWDLWGKPWPRTTLSFRTSPLNWCGNLHRIPGCLSSYSLFYPFSGFYPREVKRLTGRLPRQCAHALAMTGNSSNSNLSGR